MYVIRVGGEGGGGGAPRMSALKTESTCGPRYFQKRKSSPRFGGSTKRTALHGDLERVTLSVPSLSMFAHSPSAVVIGGSLCSAGGGCSSYEGPLKVPIEEFGFLLLF